jgi:hypothetical protein
MQSGSPGRRAAAYWFVDGLPEIASGVEFAAMNSVALLLVVAKASGELTWTFKAAGLAVFLLFFYLLSPFFFPIFWAAVIASVFGPLYKSLNRRLHKPSLSASLVFLVVKQVRAVVEDENIAVVREPIPCVSHAAISFRAIDRCVILKVGLVEILIHVGIERLDAPAPTKSISQSGERVITSYAPPPVMWS